MSASASPSDKSRLRGVFTRKEQVARFLRAIKERDVGRSVVITGILLPDLEACREAGVRPRTINYSLGIWGKKEKLPDETTLSISTMRGHHMISPKFAKHVMDQVEKSRMTPEEEAHRLATFCCCGIFNPCAAPTSSGRTRKRKKGKTMASYKIGILNGDDIGLEIVPVTVEVLKAALARHEAPRSPLSSMAP
jgi:hypothetical protein